MTKRYVYLQKTTSTSRSSLQPFSLGVGNTLVRAEDLSKADIADLQRDPSILASAPDMPVKLIAPVNKTAHQTLHSPAARDFPQPQQDLLDETISTWGIRAVRADTSPFSGEGAVVAILDTGIDLTHECFAGVDITTRNFTDDAEDHDINSHGTHCAGTVFGQAVTGKPRIGVAPGISRAIIGKVLGGAEGFGSTAGIVQGIQWAVEEGAHIISMSLGIDFHATIIANLNANGSNMEQAISIALDDYHNSLKFYEAIAQYAQTKHGNKPGTVIIAASGNGSRRFDAQMFEAPCGLPAAAENIIAIGALGRFGDLSGNMQSPIASALTVTDFSNYNVDISAPGLQVLSSIPGNQYELSDGTSMATPHVAGVAALWIDRQLKTLGRFDPAMLKHQLQGNASVQGVLNIDAELNIDVSDIGIGLVQAPQ